jgi:hypothetical protein
MTKPPKLKMGRRKNTGNIKVALKELVELFKLDTCIPVSFAFAREFDLLPEERIKENYKSELIFD